MKSAPSKTMRLKIAYDRWRMACGWMALIFLSVALTTVCIIILFLAPAVWQSIETSGHLPPASLCAIIYYLQFDNVFLSIMIINALLFALSFPIINYIIKPWNDNDRIYGISMLPIGSLICYVVAFFCSLFFFGSDTANDCKDARRRYSVSQFLDRVRIDVKREMSNMDAGNIYNTYDVGKQGLPPKPWVAVFVMDTPFNYEFIDENSELHKPLYFKGNVDPKGSYTLFLIKVSRIPALTYSWRQVIRDSKSSFSVPTGKSGTSTADQIKWDISVITRSPEAFVAQYSIAGTVPRFIGGELKESDIQFALPDVLKPKNRPAAK